MNESVQGDRSFGRPQRDGERDRIPFSLFWRPAIRILRNLGFRTKALIIVTGFLVPMCLLAWHYFDARWQSVLDTRQERAGVAFARVLLPAIRHGRDLRRFTLTEAVGGRASVELADIDRKLMLEFADIQRANELFGAALGTREAVAALPRHRQEVQPASAGVFKVFASHSRFNQALLAVLARITDGSGLVLDPRLGTNYLMDAGLIAIPGLLEQVERMRVLAASSALTGEGAELAAIELGRQDGAIEHVLEKLKNDLRIAVGAHPDLKASLSPIMAVKAIDHLRDLSSDAPGTGGAAKAKEIDRAGTAAVEALESLQSAAVGALETELASREAALIGEMKITLVVIALFVCAAIYLFHAFSLTMRFGLSEVRRHLDAISAGNLTSEPQIRGRDEAAYLLATLDAMRKSLREIVVEVRQDADGIAQASTQLDAGAQNLAHRTRLAATHVQQSASAMEQISCTVQDTAQHAHQATALAGRNAGAATRGREVIGQVISTMEEIRTASGEIAHIVGTIDAIAFQTSILALNASVEATRAGESGLGFAVVAGEVRALALRSAQAAQKIKDLIAISMKKVETGSEVVTAASDSMAEIVASARQVEALLAQIANSAREQAQGVVQVGQGFHELDATTRQDAALVVDTADATGALRGQAQHLAALMTHFKV